MNFSERDIMSYRKAETSFEDNTGRIDPSEDPVMFNINNGLKNLAKAIRSDMEEIKNLLRAVCNKA